MVCLVNTKPNIIGRETPITHSTQLSISAGNPDQTVIVNATTTRLQPLLSRNHSQLQSTSLPEAQDDQKEFVTFDKYMNLICLELSKVTVLWFPDQLLLQLFRSHSFQGTWLLLLFNAILCQFSVSSILKSTCKYYFTFIYNQQLLLLLDILNTHL